MDIHYNAFISYRHHPDDIRVAEEIHKGLERFKVPRAIKKRSSGPMRLFRDKEELPITSHLTDDISRALENSDFLIVICSPHTKESVWVQREIETFLRTHSRDKVLTVLAEGEPYDVIPDILLHEDVVDPITGQIRRQEIEPLSCDWRMKKRKAVREELPRLAAPLLHCAYDELRQRQRQYRMRRTVAAFSAALAASLGLTVYFINTSIQIQKANDDLSAANQQIREANVQIQDNLDQALRNQSQYLASSSQERMDAGDRLTAIALALEALPEEGEDRPYVASAEYALSNALNSYQTGEEILAQGAYAADNLVEDFILSLDAQKIYLLDARQVLTVWDVDTFQKLHTVDASEYTISQMYVTAQDNVIFRNDFLDRELICVDLEGNELWRVRDAMDIAFLNGRTEAMVLQYDYKDLHRILFLDPDTGRQTREPMALQMGEDGGYGLDFLQQEYEAGQPALLRYYASGIYSAVVADLEDGGIRSLVAVDSSNEGGNHWIDGACLVQGNRVVVMCGDGSGYYNGSYGGVDVTGLDRADIWCFDPETGKQLWQTELVTYMYTGACTVKPIPESEWVLLQNGNTFLVCDSRTGEQIALNQTTALPLAVKVSDVSAVGVLENGDYYIFNFESGNCSATGFLDGSVDMALAQNGFFVHTELSTQVSAYWTGENTDGTRLELQMSSTVRFHQQSGDNFAVKTYDALYMLDSRDQSLRWSVEAEYSWEMLGFTADGGEFLVYDPYEDVAIAFDTEDGKQRQIPLPAQLGEHYTGFESNAYLLEQTLLYLLESDGALCLMQVDLQTGQTLLELPLDALVPEETTFSDNSQILLATDAYVWIYRDDGAVHVIDLSTGRVKPLAEGLNLAPPLAYSKDLDQVLLGVGHRVQLMTADGTELLRIELEDLKAVSLCFYENQLLALCDDGDLYRYDRLGHQRSHSTLHIFNTFGNNASGDLEDPGDLQWWVTEDGDLILNAFRAGNIVDTQTWQLRAFVPYLLSYQQTTDTLMTVDTYTLVVYPRYSTGQQMERGWEELGQFRLSQAEREYYGLNEA